MLTPKELRELHARAAVAIAESQRLLQEAADIITKTGRAPICEQK